MQLRPAVGCRSAQSEELPKSATYHNARRLVAPDRKLEGPSLGGRGSVSPPKRGRRCQQWLDCSVSAMPRYVKVVSWRVVLFEWHWVVRGRPASARRAPDECSKCLLRRLVWGEVAKPPAQTIGRACELPVRSRAFVPAARDAVRDWLPAQAGTVCTHRMVAPLRTAGDRWSVKGAPMPERPSRHREERV